jgi:PTH1 family peptidyl-tRNA hydrolase
VKSIISSLGDAGFPRVRVGIGRPAPGRDPADWVLSDFSRAEAAVLPELIVRAADAVESIIKDGLTTAMNRFNGKQK